MTTPTKYPRTFHLPESPGMTTDDKRASKEALAHLTSLDNLVVTENMDGVNFTMYRDYRHARSLDSTSLPSEAMATQEWLRVSYLIPEGWRVCGGVLARPQEHRL